jgi:hypothetical protein
MNTYSDYPEIHSISEEEEKKRRLNYEILKEERYIFRQKTKRNFIIEFSIWWFIGSAFFLYPIFLQGDSKVTISKAYLDNLGYVSIGLFFAFFPIIFRLIFGVVPFQSLRNKVLYKDFLYDPYSLTTKANPMPKGSSIQDAEMEYSLICIQESNTIAEKIYSRSGVYLLVGCMIAFMGVGIFSVLFSTPDKLNESTWDRALDYLPRFGSLFFIEYIAFFFLKQYRVIQEEYRYYEGIKRRRQDTHNFVRLVVKHKLDKDVSAILKESYKEGQSTVLKKGETTQLLEVQKLSSEETAIFSKFIDVLRDLKKTDKKARDKVAGE